MQIFRQLGLLLWKNFILQIRRPIGTAVEVLLPVGFVALLIIARVKIENKEKCFSTFDDLGDDTPIKLPNNFTYPKTIPTYSGDSKAIQKTLDDAGVTYNIPIKFAYYPINTETTAIIEKIEQLKMLPLIYVFDKNVTFSGTEEDFAVYITEQRTSYLGAVTFQSWAGGKYAYKVRLPHSIGMRKTWRTDRVYNEWTPPGPRKNTQYEGPFLELQQAVDSAIMMLNSIPVPATRIKQFPYPGYKEDTLMQIVRGVLPTMFLLAFIYTGTCIIKELVYEKQCRLKESMKMMGMANWLHWIAWFIKFILFFMITCGGITILLKYGKIFEYSEGGVIFIWLLMYCISNTFVIAFLSTLFSRTVTAQMICSSFWFVSMIPFWTMNTPEKFDSASTMAKMGMCILPNSCMGISINYITKFEIETTGATWANLNEEPTLEDNFTMAQVLMMNLISCIIFGILTWYVEAVNPGSYGIPLPPYFPFMPSYWCGSSVKNVADMNDHKIEPNPDCEPDPEGLDVGVGIFKLRKIYKSATGKKIAVDGMSLKMYKGQITALLGHNGAGKTTTMSMLTGLFPPTSGNAYINGMSILKDMQTIRGNLGLCPQHNVLWDRLTVKEHLQFFCALKGMSKKDAEAEISQMITDIQLADKPNAQSRTLSGGMKRKLSCAIALIGNSEVVFLDEPTSGMDPYARRATWDLLQKYRTNKTIILTTHFMDEADYLGDRIAIMAHGQLRCSGSSLFLKKRYGVGYHLTLVKGTSFQENAVISMINGHVPTAKMVGNVAAEMSYILEDESSKQFKGLFKDLEATQQQNDITTFGVSLTTLEEVFLKVGENEEIRKSGGSVVDVQRDHQPLVRTESYRQEEKVTGMGLWMIQFKAMITKRYIDTKRDRKGVAKTVFVPLILVLVGFILFMTSTSSQADSPERVLNLGDLEGQKTKINLGGYYAFFGYPNSSMESVFWKETTKMFNGWNIAMTDITNQSSLLLDENLGNSLRYTYTGSSHQLGATYSKCCSYKYGFMNQQCLTEIHNSTKYAEICGTTESGYKECSSCVGSSNSASCNMVSENLADPRDYFQNQVLEESQSDVKKFFLKKVVGVSFEKNGTFGTANTGKVTVWYSNQALHTVVSAYNAVSNLLLKSYKDDSFEIKTSNHPLPRNAQETADVASANLDTLTFVIFQSFAACFAAAGFITFIVQEKQSKAKHVQFVSGVSATAYWIAAYCWDWIFWLIPTLLIMILFACFDNEAFRGELGYVFLVLILFGFAMIPFVYLLSWLFTQPLVAYGMISGLGLVLCMMMVIAVIILRIPQLDALEEGEICFHIFALIPMYLFPQALNDIAVNRNMREVHKLCVDSINQKSADFEAMMASSKLNFTMTNPFNAVSQCSGFKYAEDTLEWAMPGIGIHCLYFFIEGIVYFVLVLLIEKKMFINYCRSSKRSSYSPVGQEDLDVANERNEVNNLDREQIGENAIVLDNITKTYGSGLTAVDHCCVKVKKGECFGLLGVNGAGKTTTFGMLTGELPMTSGTAYLNGYDIQKNLKEVQQNIGYCPQFDALSERLTGREMLTMFAQLRGIPGHKIEQVVQEAIEMLNLKDWADKMCGDYSGGNKRKLSTAMALVGDPAIIFLDEPTSGMDPTSRRFLWDTLTKILNSGKSIVLTSHSMEECEALCTRLVIMVNGKFKCMGGIQHLKSLYGKGFTLMIKVDGKAPQQQQQPQQNVEGASSNAGFATDQVAIVVPNGNSGHEVAYAKQGYTNGNVIVPAANQGAVPAFDNLFYNSQTVKQFVQETFTGAFLIEDRQGLLQYQINDPAIAWSYMFGALEENAERLNIIDYSVSQTSLEQVFINFAKEQHSEDRPKKRGCCSCCYSG